jgi:hypothetical protein
VDRKHSRGGREVGRVSKHLANDPFVDSRKRLDIVHRRALADLMHGGIGQAEIHHRA